MNKMNLKYVEDTEHCLFLMLAWLRDMEQQLIGTKDQEQRTKLKYELEEGRIRFSQMQTSIAIFKAKHGIFTLPKELK